MKEIHIRLLFVIIIVIVISILGSALFFFIQQKSERGSEFLPQDGIQKIKDRELIDLNVFDIKFDQGFDAVSYFGENEVMTSDSFFRTIGDDTPGLGDDKYKGLILPEGYSRSKKVLRMFWGKLGRGGEGDEFTAQGLKEALPRGIQQHVASIKSVYLFQEEGMTPQGFRGSFPDMIVILFTEGTDITEVIEFAEQMNAEIAFANYNRYSLWTPTQTEEGVLDFIGKVESLNDERIEVVDKAFHSSEVLLNLDV